MKKIRILALALLIVCTTLLFASCFGLGEVSQQPQQTTQKNGTPPVYEGISLQGDTNILRHGQAARFLAPGETAGEDASFSVVEGDCFDKVIAFDPEVDPFVPGIISLEEKAADTLDVLGAASDIYYAEKNQDLYVVIRLSNPDNYEIQSFTLNGVKYANYMFEKGSDMENLILKINVGDVAGVIEYTLDSIKYIDGTEIKDVKLDGETTVKAGVRTDDPLTIALGDPATTLRSISFSAVVQDKYGLIESTDGYLKALLYDGETVQEKDLSIGENTVVFDGLTPNTAYQYAVAAYYDDLGGDGAALHTYAKKAVVTDAEILFCDVTVSKTSVEWDYRLDDECPDLTVSGLELYLDGEKVSEPDAAAKSADGLLSDRAYTIVAHYDGLDGQDATISITVRTAAKQMPTVAINDVAATQTSVTFATSVTDVDQVGAISKIELLHGDDVTVAEDLTVRAFENILSNNEYAIRVTYTYDLNDGAGERTFAQTAEIKTAAKQMPTVSITEIATTQTSVTFATLTTDADQIGAITKIELLHGDDVTVAEDLSVRAFENLLSNNEYTIRVTYTYDANDGKGAQTLVATQEFTTVAKQTPILLINDVSVTQTSVTFGTSVTDADQIGAITKIELLHGNDAAVAEDLSVRVFENLFSNNEYAIRVTYTYDANDGKGAQTLVQTAEFRTAAKQMPTLAINDVAATQTSVTFAASVTDADQIGAITKIELLHGDDVTVAEDLTVRAFENLFSNNEYAIRVTYTYDANDGAGAQTLVQTAEFKTAAKQAPTVSVTDLASSRTEIVGSLTVSDPDGVCTVDEVAIYKGDDKVGTVDERDHLVFSGLKSGATYRIVVSFSYDLNDGNGSHSETFAVDYPTLVESIAVEEMILLNNNVVKHGEELNLRVYFINPSEIEITAIYVNGQRVTVVGGDRIESAIVKFVPDEIGLIDFAVDRVDYTYQSFPISQAIDSDVSVQYPIFGDLEINYTPITALPYDNSGDGVYLSFDNEYGYTVYAINGSTDFVRFDDGQYFTSATDVSSIEYGYEHYGHTTQTCSYSTPGVVSFGKTFQKVSTAEEFLSMTDGYYYLTADLDLRNVTLEQPIAFTGVLIGNGHKIRGLHNVIDTSKMEYYDIVDRSYWWDPVGTFYDVSFTELYISVNATSDKRVTISPLGGARLVNCTVRGDIIGNQYVTVADLTGVQNSSTFNVNITLDGKASTLKYTAEKTLEKNAAVTVDENGAITCTLPNGKVYFFYTFDTELTTFTPAPEVFAVGDGALKNCTRLTEVTIPDAVWCGSDVLGECPLVRATLPVRIVNDLPDSTKSNLEELVVCGSGAIGAGAFSRCSNLSSVTICDGVTGIGSRAFSRSGVISIIIGNDVTNIGDQAFYWCSNLTSITIGSSVTSIGNNAFDGCQGVHEVHYTGTVAEWCGIPLPYAYNNLYIGGVLVTDLVIPDGVTSIKAYAFSGARCLTSVTIPDGVTSIGDHAFYNCSGLTSVTIPDGVTSIGAWAFSGCSDLNSVTIPDGVTSIGDYAFYNCSKLTSITIPDGVTSIGDYAFVGCNGLTAVYYTGTVADWCGISIGYDANPLLYAHNLYIDGERVTDLVIPDGVVSVGFAAFEGCSCLTSVTIPDSVTSVGEWAFSGCTGLTSVTLGNGVTNVGYKAFNKCNNLTAITIPNGVRTIEKEAFDNCSRLQSVTFSSPENWFVTATKDSLSGTGVHLTDPAKNAAYLTSTHLQRYWHVCLQHVWGADYTVDVAPTCTTAGSKSIHCTICEVIQPDSEVVIPIDPEAHAWAPQYAVDVVPTDENAGTKSIHCTICGAVKPESAVVITASQGLKFTSNNDGTCSVTGMGTCQDADLIIPLHSPAGDRVTGIGESAFKNRTDLTSVIILDGVTTIGSNAFENCSNLTSVSIPDSVVEFGTSVFSNCGTLTFNENDNACYLGNGSNPYVVLCKAKDTSIASCTVHPQTRIICDNAFQYCRSLTAITIPDGVTTIGERAFAYCSKLISFVIPDGVTTIGYAAFEYSPGLTSVTIGAGVKTIRDYAFSNCTGLTSIVIPDSLTTIGYGAFNECNGLTSVTIGKAIAFVSSSSSIFNGCNNIMSVTLLDSAETIGDSAFRDCTWLTSITIPDSVTSIGNNAFEGCTGLISITIPAGVSKIGSHAFLNCTGLTSVVWNATNCTTAGYSDYWSVYSIFDGCTDLATVTLEDGVEIIPDYAFYGCTGLTSVTIPGSVTSIGNSAFEGCTGLTSVTIPGSVTSIGNYAFSGCTGLTSITIPGSVTSIGNYAFEGCTGLTSVTITNGVTSIGDYAFKGCTDLTNLSIPDSVTYIGEGAFNACSSLSSITLPFASTIREKQDGPHIYHDFLPFGHFFGTENYDSAIRVRTYNPSYEYHPDDPLNPYTFRGYSTVMTYYLPATLKTVVVTGGELREYTFMGCTGLTSITVPDGLTSIGDWAFSDCSGLTSVTITNSVKSIGDWAFHGCTGLTELVVPDSVTYIGEGAFNGCASLETITLPFAGILQVNEYDSSANYDRLTFGHFFGTDNYEGAVAVYQKYSYTYVNKDPLNPYSSDNTSGTQTYYLPAALKTVVITGGELYDYAFMGCTGLTSITISDSVTSIGNYAFSGCTGLTLITVPAGVTEIGDYAFQNCTGLTSVVWNATNCITAGSLAYPIFSGCTNLATVTFGDDVKRISAYLFCNCTGLTEIVISDSVTGIGNYAFSNCTGLTEIVIPGSVTEIGDFAFCGCTGLTSISIPDSVVELEASVFNGCDNLTFNEYDNAYYLGNESNPYAILYKAKGTSISSCTIHPQTRMICNNAFQECRRYLTTITIPDSVQIIGDFAFLYCYNLTSVTIGSGIKIIGRHAFDNCNLTSVTFRNPSGWYVTETNGANGGTVVNVSDPSANAVYLKSTYKTYFWYVCENHVWADDYSIDVAPTCTTAGSKSHHCTICGVIQPDSTVEIPATGHTWAEEYTIDVVQTCATAGTKSIHCTACGAIQPDSTVEIPATGHTWAEEYTVDVAPTCATAGSKSIHCTTCGAILPNSTVEIPIDPDAHVVDEWIVDQVATLLNDGLRHGECTLCHENVEQIYEFEVSTVYNSKEPTGLYADGNDFAFVKTTGEIRGEKSFAPTDENPDGNDLWFEYSFLWNDSLYYRDSPENLAEIRLFGFRDTTNWVNYRGFYYLYLRDNNDGFRTSTDCPFKGHIDFSTYYPGSTPGQNCAIDLTSEGNTLNGKPIGRYIAGWGAGRDDSPYLWDSEYQTLGGWHRLGFRYHQEAEIVDGEVRYSGYTELYIDGVKVWKVLTNMEGLKKGDGTWKETDWSLKGKNLLLWTAEIDENDPTKLVYTNNDAIAVEMRIDNITGSSQSVYICVDDINWTCGNGFVRNVVRIDDPEPSTATIGYGGKTLPDTRFFREHDHVWDDGHTVDVPATCVTAGSKSIHCTICGAIQPDSTVEIPATGHAWAEEYTIDVAPTCTTVGSKSIHCTACGTKQPESDVELPAFGHSWSEEYTIDVAPTCTTAGSKSIHCTACGTKQPESDVELPAFGHSWSEEYTIDVAPTCTTAGSRSIRCTVCETVQPDSEVVIPIDPDAHAWATQYTVDVVPTYENEGTKSIHCTICDTVKPESTVAITVLDLGSRGLEFTSNNDGTCYVSGIGTCQDADLIIPPFSPAGDRVTGIGEFAFRDRTELTSVTISDSVTSIGAGAFSGCSNLVSITIPFIGAEAGKTASDTYQYPLGYIFGTSSYTGGVATTQYYYGYSNSSTENTTYYIPSSLRTVAITSGNVPRGSFDNCTNLTSIILPDNVVSIGEYAFAHCYGVTELTIPNSVETIKSSAIYDCSGLTSVIYLGTKDRWYEINEDSNWDSYTVHCTDGDLTK